jgi:uncharacterized protein YbaR (Trm112 family)
MRSEAFHEQVPRMISPELLQILRCPLDPARQARLTDEQTHLLCARCGLKFAIRDGLPNLVVEEAELPPGCEGREQLPCQRESEEGADG